MSCSSQLFAQKWRQRFGLPPRDWQKSIEAHFADYPLSLRAEQQYLVEQLFTSVPDMLKERPSDSFQRLAEAYGICCWALWQAQCAFPAQMQCYAAYLLEYIQNEQADIFDSVSCLMDTLLDNNPLEERCGFQNLKLKEPDLLRDHTHKAFEGDYDDAVNLDSVSPKYQEYAYYLNESGCFEKDWKALRQHFPEQCKRHELRRSCTSPKTCKKVSFDTEEARFRASLDLLCWKYCLVAVIDGQPVLECISVQVTANGTQIFIPAYLGYAEKRDIDLTKVVSLHRARGARNQGAKQVSARIKQFRKRHTNRKSLVRGQSDLIDELILKERESSMSPLSE